MLQFANTAIDRVANGEPLAVSATVLVGLGILVATVNGLKFRAAGFDQMLEGWPTLLWALAGVGLALVGAAVYGFAY